ncbi:MAG: hypothetical protein KDD06_19885, partial [Phaeodactylibacter sp.]|nr:hypothetical protein [Phaeodactylibacter sp.]
MAPDQEKEAYRELCGSTPSLSLFHQPWWLDAACGPANWEAALARNPESGEVEAALPYAFRSRFGVRIIAPPPLTPFMGPVLFPPTGLNRFKKRAFEEQVIHRLLEQLPRLPVVRLKLHYDMQNWLPFRQAGFRQETMYSYRLAGLSDTSLAWNGFHPKLRNKINHAAQHCKVEQVEDAGPVFRLFEKSFRRKGQRNPVNADWFTGIGRALQERKAQAAFLCRGKDGEPLA